MAHPVCSARFWLIAFNEAIQIINEPGIIGNGYADDCSALIGGTHPHNMIDKMQAMLGRLVAWGNSCNLRFNAQKTVVVMFTRSHRSFPRQLRMDGQLIPYSDSVVYLGVTLDTELKWKAHVDSKITKTKRLIMKLASITNAYWGPKPKLMKWAYTGIVRPALSYAAAIWGHVLHEDGFQDSLRKINRAALCTIVKVPRSTPTRAMEVILDILPLHLHVKKEGFRTYLRLHREMTLSWRGTYSNLTFSVSHRKYWETMAQHEDTAPLTAITDDINTSRPTLNFTLDIHSFVDMHRAQQPANCNVYTDGSKMGDKVGAGVYIFRSDITIAEASFRLPDTATVYQAEMLAIREAATILQAIPDLTSIKIYVDSQAALRSFQADFVKSRLALQTIEELNKINHDSLTFVWTKAHVGTEGNEKADELAKQGTSLTHITDVPTPSCEAKNVVDRTVRTLWQKE